MGHKISRNLVLEQIKKDSDEMTTSSTNIMNDVIVL